MSEKISLDSSALKSVFLCLAINRYLASGNSQFVSKSGPFSVLAAYLLTILF